MFRQSLLKSAPVFKSAVQQQSRSYAKATIVGRLGSAPIEKQTGDGRQYYIYSVAVNRPPKRGADGKLVEGPDGYPVRDCDWFSVFNFRENASAGMQALQGGDLVLVDAILQSRKIGDGPESETIFRIWAQAEVYRETSHRVLDRPNKQ